MYKNPLDYYILGLKCTPVSNALSSNTKFINPISNVYDIQKGDRRFMHKYEAVNNYEELIENKLQSMGKKTGQKKKCSTC